MGVVQIHKRIIQNQKHLLRVKQSIRQRQTHTQQYKIRLTGAEIGKLPHLPLALQLNLKIHINQKSFIAAAQHGQVETEA